MEDKIDFIIAWVDGNDLDWQKTKKRFANNNTGDQRTIRFRDWDNLHFWFRGVEKYTPWVNKIFFVTWGHLPNWLKTGHPKLQVVNHEDYIPGEYLPTFNSHVIELNLHRIDNLAEQFVYFNDDMFVINRMNEWMFFEQGLPCDSAIIMPNISEFRNSIAGIVSNNMEIINTVYDKNVVLKNNLFKWFNPKYKKYLLNTLLSIPYKNFTGFYNPHLPHSYLKETFMKLWETEFEILHQTCLHKFRDGRDVNQWLFRYLQFVKGKFMPRSVAVGNCFSLTNNNKEVVSAIREQAYKVVCLNDNDKDPIRDFIKEKELIKEAFEHILPEKSSFEL
jgi:hypothetical protein